MISLFIFFLINGNAPKKLGVNREKKKDLVMFGANVNYLTISMGQNGKKKKNWGIRIKLDR